MVFGLLILLIGMGLFCIAFSGKVWSFVGIGGGIMLAGMFIGIGSSPSKGAPNGSPGMVTLGWIILIICVGVVVYYVVAANRNPVTSVEPGINTPEGLMKKAKSLCDSKSIYLERYKEDVDYKVLKKAFDELPTAYNRWLQEILSTPMIGKKPINTYVAAGIGTGIAGVGGGIIMGVSAQNQNNLYEQRVKEFTTHMSRINSNREKVYFLVTVIERITTRPISKIENVEN